MKHIAFPIAVVVMVGLAGCVPDYYRIELAPKGKVLERTLTVWHGSGKEESRVGEEKLTALAKVYGKSLSDPNDARQRFRGEFGPDLPGDVGGKGYYLYYESRMGSAGIYVERFRGNDDFLAALTKMQSSADELTDLVIGWFETELGREEGFASLRGFLDQECRRDLKNVSLNAWAASLAEKSDPEVGLRAAMFLAERGYLQTTDVPSYMNAIWGLGNEQEELRLMSLLQRLLARRIGIPDDRPVPESLGFLADPQAAKESFSAYLRTTPQYRRYVEERAAAAETKPAGESETQPSEPDALDLPGELLGDLVLVGGGGPDDLGVSLALDVAPFETNGARDADGRLVRWNAALLDPAKPPTRLPVFCFALWATPNEETQMRHFGRVLLDGKELLGYCLWENGLPPAAAQQLQDALRAARPDNYEQVLRAFRFSGPPPLPTTAPIEWMYTTTQPATRPSPE